MTLVFAGKLWTNATYLFPNYPSTIVLPVTPMVKRHYRAWLPGEARQACSRVEDATLSDLSMELEREYISYLKSAPKFENHHFKNSNGNRVRVLRAFSSWPHHGGYADENVLGRLKITRAPKKILETLSWEEIKRLFKGLDQKR